MQAEVTNATGNVSTCLLHNQLRLPLVLFYSAVVLVGLPANLLTVWLTWRQVRRKNVLGVYLCGLSVCDLIYLCTLPLWAFYIAGGRWPWGSVACQVTGFIFFTNMYISILLLCCISCDRYIAVGYALESRGLRRMRVAAGVTAATVATVMLAHVPVFLIREGEVDHGKDRCFEPDLKPSTVVMAFNYARFILGFLVPLVLLATFNRGILRGVRASHALPLCQKRRVRALACTVVTLFLVCFAPYHLILLVRTSFSHFPQLEEKAACGFSQWIYNVSLGFSTLNCACNPILYVLSSEDVRKELSLELRGRGGVTGEPGPTHTRPHGRRSELMGLTDLRTTTA